MIHEIVQSILERGLPERMTIQDLLPFEPEDVDCQREVSFRKGYNFGLEVYRQQLTKVLTEVVGELVDKEKIQKLINDARGNTDYPVEDYELRADEGDYHPNEHERFLIEDYHQGYIDLFDEELIKAITDRNIEILKGE